MTGVRLRLRLAWNTKSHLEKFDTLSRDFLVRLGQGNNGTIYRQEAFVRWLHFTIENGNVIAI